MIPLREIGLKSRANKEDLANLNIQPADPDKSKFKRNVIDMNQKIKDKLKNHKLFQEHVYNVLHNSNIGKSTALYIRPSTL